MKAVCAIQNASLGDVIAAVGPQYGYVRLCDFPFWSRVWGLFIFSAAEAGIAVLEAHPAVLSFSRLTETENDKWPELDAQPSDREAVNAWAVSAFPAGFDAQFGGQFVLPVDPPESTADEDVRLMVAHIVQSFVDGWVWGGDDVRAFE